MINKLKEMIPDGVFEDKCLKEYTTFKVGGPAKLFICVSNVEMLKKAVSVLKSENCPFFVIGNGSNLLVSDKGFDGAVIRLEGDFLELKSDGKKITAGAGVILSKVCNLARDKELTGLEFAYGIPGTVGGAMVMNAGAYDGEMSYVVESVDLLDKSGNVVTYSCEEMEFGYRDSVLKHTPFIALRTVFRLEAGDGSAIQARMNELMEKRRSRQPLEFPSAGSTFKRPEGYFAGKLIMDAGLSGKRVGGASVSAKHCGFVVNDKNGTAADIDMLMKQVTDEVYNAFNVRLEPEVIRIGDFD